MIFLECIMTFLTNHLIWEPLRYYKPIFKQYPPLISDAGGFVGGFSDGTPPKKHNDQKIVGISINHNILVIDIPSPNNRLIRRILNYRRVFIDGGVMWSFVVSKCLFLIQACVYCYLPHFKEIRW